MADLGDGPGGPSPLYFGKGKRPAGQVNQDRAPALSSRSGSATASCAFCVVTAKVSNNLFGIHKHSHLHITNLFPEISVL